MIRILIVDDSAFMRKALSMMLEEDPDIQVVATARDGLEAIEKVRELKPDLVTLDIEMPRMDGLTALKKIMKDHPCPVIMISSLTKEGAQATLEALNAGAVDFIPKQLSFVSLEITKIKADLIAKIKAIAGTRAKLHRPSGARPPAPKAPSSDGAEATSLVYRRARLLAIGVSTGGPAALQKVIPLLPADLPVPVVVVQHMPPHFTQSLANRLNNLSPIEVVEAEEGMEVRPGRVIIAAGGKQLVFRGRGDHMVVSTPTKPATLHMPSVDVMFQSAAAAFNGRVLGVVMTGMGHDGREGATAIRRRGGKIIAQDEATCVVYGMPRAVKEAGQADAVVSLQQLAATITAAITGSAEHASRPAPQSPPASRRSPFTRSGT